MLRVISVVGERGLTGYVDTMMSPSGTSECLLPEVEPSVVQSPGSMLKHWPKCVGVDLLEQVPHTVSQRDHD